MSSVTIPLGRMLKTRTGVKSFPERGFHAPDAPRSNGRCMPGPRREIEAIARAQVKITTLSVENDRAANAVENLGVRMVMPAVHITWTVSPSVRVEPRGDHAIHEVGLPRERAFIPGGDLRTGHLHKLPQTG